MPSTSETQRKLMGWAYCYKIGKCKDAPRRVRDLAKKMTEKDLKDFATKESNDLNCDEFKYDVIEENRFLTFKNFLSIYTNGI